jgi:hypothetical protein
LLTARPPEAIKPLLRRRWFLALCGLLIISAVVMGSLLISPVPAPKVSNYIQLTHDGLPKALVGTDGSRLYLGFARTINYNASIGILQMSASGGEPVRIPTGSRAILPLSVSSDGAALLVKDNQGTEYTGEIWRLPILGGSPIRLGGVAGQDATWSPDGKCCLLRRKRHVCGQERWDGIPKAGFGARPGLLCGMVASGNQTEVYRNR